MSSPLIKKLMAETTPLQKQQVEDRIQLAMDLDKLVKNQFDSYTMFAAHIGRSVSEVSRWLSGTHNLTTNTLSEIANGLGYSLKELFAKIEDRPQVVLVINQQITAESTGINFPRQNVQQSEYSLQVNA